MRDPQTAGRPRKIAHISALKSLWRRGLLVVAGPKVGRLELWILFNIALQQSSLLRCPRYTSAAKFTHLR